jgi:hypothetical protein
LAYCNRRTKRQIIDGASVKENNRRHIWRIRHIWRLAASSVGDQENLKRFLRRDNIPRSAALPVERLNLVELYPLALAAPQTQDICLGGFYVGMSLNLKVSAELEITLWIGDTKISGKAMVVSSHPVFGNGIKFSHLADGNRSTTGVT